MGRGWRADGLAGMAEAVLASTNLVPGSAKPSSAAAEGLEE
jgi:hypothetical protein